MNNGQNEKNASDQGNHKSSQSNNNPNKDRRSSVSRRRQYFLTAVIVALCIGGAATARICTGLWGSKAENTTNSGAESETESADAAGDTESRPDEKNSSSAVPPFVSEEKPQDTGIIQGLPIELVQAAQREGELTVYGSCEEAYLSAACVHFEVLYGIRVHFERLPASEVYTRAREAGGMPQADVWFGSSAAVCREAIRDGLLEAYAAENAGQLMDEEYRDPEGYWYGMDRDLLGFIVNRDRLSERGVEIPQSWAALTGEAYRGMIAMPNPNIAPAAKQLLCMLASQQGEAAAMEYFRALDQNVMQYTENDAKPAELAISGECAVGICFLKDGIAALRGAEDIAAEKSANDACVLVLPEDGSLSVLRATAIFRGCTHPKAARLWTEYVLSPACVELAEKSTAYAFPVIASAAQPEEVQRFQLDVTQQNPKMVYDSDIADTDGTALVNAFFEMIGNSAESPGFERFYTE